MTASHRKEKRMEVVWDDATETFPQGEGEEEGGPEQLTPPQGKYPKGKGDFAPERHGEKKVGSKVI